MKKRIGLTVTIVLLLILALLIAAGYTWLAMKDAKDKEVFTDATVTLEELANQLCTEHQEISMDEDSGMIFVNNEIVVLADIYATRADMEALAVKYNATIIDATEDIGIYLFQLDDNQSLDELESLIAKIKQEALVADAFINPVSLIEKDTGDSGVVPDPIFPSDPWEYDDWDTDAPNGTNWSAEAVRAPQAWGYFDQLQHVNIGLIDAMPDMNHEDLEVTAAYANLYDQDSSSWSTYEIDNSVIPAEDHGTHVAGTMAATWNGVGLSGLVGDHADLYYSCAYNVSGGSLIVDYYTAYTYVKAISTLLDQDVCAINISQNTSRLIGFAASRGNSNAISYLTSQADLAEAMLMRIIKARQADGRPDFVICISAGNSNIDTYYPDSSAYYGYSESPAPGMPPESGETGGSLALYNNFLALIDEPTVMDRIIVVGAVGMENNYATSYETRYYYAAFSNVGDRVNIAAPGMQVYSSVVGGYDSYPGTSMAAPHVTATAGMVFAANPDLTGPEVKAILLASTYDKFVYEGGTCGLLDMSMAVSKGLETLDTTVHRVVGTTPTNELDICFLVDTTGSMVDDIDNAKENMVTILETLKEKTDDYRVAIVDYRDFAERTETPEDYPAKIQLNFSDDPDAILCAINGLTLGNGGDIDETVYSAFATALTLDWRLNSIKVIIVLGDAPPLDPEPYTGYTYESIMEAVYNAKISIGEPAPADFADGFSSSGTSKSEDIASSGEAESLIKIYSIGTEASEEAQEFFEAIAEATGGMYTNVGAATEVANAIQGSIEMIEMDPVQTVTADFGREFSGETVALYRNDRYYFSVPLDSNGEVTLVDMPIEELNWEITRLHRSGTLEIVEKEDDALINIREGEWNSFLYVLWERKRTQLFLCVEGILVVMIIFLFILNMSLKSRDTHSLRGRSGRSGRSKNRGGWDSSPTGGSYCPTCGEYLAPGASCSRCSNILDF